jgi:O-antigen/teichoic acid export membrane protein
MGVATAGQLFANLPIGGLMGLQRQAEANLWTMGYSMVRSGLVVLPLWLVPDLLTYFAWQAVVGVIFALLMRRALWQALALVGHRARVSRLPLQRVYRFALGMFGMSIIAALNTQMDKLVASRLFPIGDFAVYALASLAGQVPSLLTVPIALALLPRLTALAEASDRIALSRLLHVGSGGIAWISAAAAALLCAFPAEVLLVWSGDARIAAQGRLPLMLLSAGGLCLALQLMPYHLALAHGHSRTNLVLGAVVAAVLPFATWALARERGLAGAALPWLVLNLLALAVLGAVLLRRFLPGESCRWWVRDTLLPTVSCFVLAFLIRSFVSDVLPPAVDRSTALMLLSPALMSLPVLALVVLGFARRAAQRIVS